MNYQPHPEMTELLRTFPVLKDKLAYWPWDPDERERILRNVYPVASSGERCAIEFLLSVWDPNTDWTKHGFRNFNLVYAIQILGGYGKNVDAIVGWIQQPFRP